MSCPQMPIAWVFCDASFALLFSPSQQKNTALCLGVSWSQFSSPAT